MTKLLIDERPLFVLPSLAKKVGLKEAIVLQQLHYWIRHIGPSGQKYGRIKDKRRWIRNTIDEWQEKNFSFISRSSLYRAFENLEEQGAIISRSDLNRHGYDKTKWYSIDYEAISKWDMEFVKMEDPYNLNGITIPDNTINNTKDISTANKKQPDLLDGILEYSQSQEINVDHYPVDVQETIEMIASRWGFRVPSKEEKRQKGYWIKRAREIKKECGTLGLDVIDIAWQAWKTYKEKEGEEPFPNVADIGSIVKWFKLVVRKLKQGEDVIDDSPDFSDPAHVLDV